MGLQPELNSTCRKSQYKLLFWIPILSGFCLPFAFFLVGIGVSWSAWAIEWYELISMTFSSAILASPFVLISFLTRKDFQFNERAKQEEAVRKWFVRFVPVLILYIILILDVTVSAVKRLPGSSSSGIALIYFPVIGIPLVIVLHKFSGRIF